MPPTDDPPTLAALVHGDALDAELAALLWILIEGGVPLVVCGPAPEARRREFASALIQLAWEGAAAPADAAIAGPSDAWSAMLSARVLALRPGDRFAAVVKADSLRDLLALVTAEPDGLSSDEARALGLVVVVGRDGRVEAAHLLRPVERDAGDHLQRRPPAVLAARDAASGRLEHFDWAIGTELAARAGVPVGAFQQQHDERAAFLAALAEAGIEDQASVASAVRGFRLTGAAGDHRRH